VPLKLSPFGAVPVVGPFPGVVTTPNLKLSGTHDAPSQAVDGPPVPTDVTIKVTADGISDLRFSYSDPDFFEVGNPMNVWMAANHPDVVEAEAIDFGSWTTIEEATTNGLLTAEYSAEWASYLEENDCASTA
jgi:hypothetical protein